MIKMPKNNEYIKFENYEKKKKSQFMMYADFERLLVPKEDGKQNPDESYENKNKKHVAYSYRYKLVCVCDKFTKSFNS